MLFNLQYMVDGLNIGEAILDCLDLTKVLSICFQRRTRYYWDLVLYPICEASSPK